MMYREYAIKQYRLYYLTTHSASDCLCPFSAYFLIPRKAVL